MNGTEDMTKLTNKEKRQKLFDLCERAGFWNVHTVTISKQLNTAHANISRWKKQYIEKYGEPDIKQIGKEININSQSALKELVKLMKSGDNRVKVQAAKSFFESVEKYTRFLESFDYKVKVAEKLDLGGIEFNIHGIEDKYPNVEEDDETKPNKKTKTKMS